MSSGKQNQDNRKEIRFKAHSHIILEYRGYVQKGEVLDWSLHGIHLSIFPPPNNKMPGFVRLNITKGTPGTQKYQEWIRNGVVRWIRFSKQGWHVGIKFDNPLDFIPFDNPDSYFASVSSRIWFLNEP